MPVGQNYSNNIQDKFIFPLQKNEIEYKACETFLSCVVFIYVFSFLFNVSVHYMCKNKLLNPLLVISVYSFLFRLALDEGSRTFLLSLFLLFPAWLLNVLV